MMRGEATVERSLNLLWIALGLSTIAGAIGIGVWDTKGPGSGFLPLLAGIVIAACGASLLFTARNSETTWPRGFIAARLAVVPAGLVAIGLFMPHVGFVLAALPVMIALMLAIERQSLLAVLAISIISSVGVYLVFTRLLGTKLPASRLIGL